MVPLKGGDFEGIRWRGGAGQAGEPEEWIWLEGAVPQPGGQHGSEGDPGCFQNLTGPVDQKQLSRLVELKEEVLILDLVEAGGIFSSLHLCYSLHETHTKIDLPLGHIGSWNGLLKRDFFSRVTCSHPKAEKQRIDH